MAVNAATHPRPFAVFDIDGTLIRWQLFHAIVHSLGKHGHLPVEAHERIKAARKVWKMRATDEGFTTYEKVLVEEYFAALERISPEQLDDIAGEVFEEYKDQTYAYTRGLLKKLKAEGYFLLAISGSHDAIIQKMARYYGFDAALGASHEKVGGRFSGNVGYSPVFGKGEVLAKFIKQYDLTAKGSVAVGDSKSDVPVLELVDHPIAFNPDKKLFAIAAAHRWKVVVERKNMVYELEPRNRSYTLKA